jgi:hypothetical protein
VIGFAPETLFVCVFAGPDRRVDCDGPKH